MHIFIDVETTGLKLPKGSFWARPDPSIQSSYVLQVAWYRDGQAEATCRLIHPCDWIQEGVNRAFETHGITETACRENGVPLRQAMEELLGDMEKAETVVAHNLSFDLRLIMMSFWRCGLGQAALDVLPSKTYICTRRGLSKDIRSVIRSSFPDEKTDGTRLSLLHRHLFGRAHDNAHDARGDVLATEKCFRELENRGYRWPCVQCRDPPLSVLATDHQ